MEIAMTVIDEATYAMDVKFEFNLTEKPKEDQ